MDPVQSLQRHRCNIIEAHLVKTQCHSVLLVLGRREHRVSLLTGACHAVGLVAAVAAFRHAASVVDRVW
jgi:hypothetical protein